MATRFNTVHDVLENYKSSILEKDVERFLSAYHSDIHLFDSWEKWESIGLSKWKDTVKEWFNGLNEEGVLLKVDFADLVVEECSTIAFAHCTVSFTAQNAESRKELRKMTNRFTFCLEKVNESWMIKHEHSSLPISLETGKGMFNLK